MSDSKSTAIINFKTFWRGNNSRSKVDNVRHMFNLQTYWYNKFHKYALEIIQIID